MINSEVKQESGDLVREMEIKRMGVGVGVIWDLVRCRKNQDFFGEMGWEVGDKRGRPAWYEGMRYGMS